MRSVVALFVLSAAIVSAQVYPPIASGSGSVVLTSGAGAPSANCAGPSPTNLAEYIDTTNQDRWWCSATNTWKLGLSATGTGPYTVTGGTGSAPSNPTGANLTCYFATATNRQVCLDSSGIATSMVRVISGTAAMGTGAISSGTCATAVTVTATGVATTDVVTAGFNGDPTGVTGYVPLTTGMLTIIGYPGTDQVIFKVCNNTESSITPGALTLNWRVSK